MEVANLLKRIGCLGPFLVVPADVKCLGKKPQSLLFVPTLHLKETGDIESITNSFIHETKGLLPNFHNLSERYEGFFVIVQTE